MTDTATTEQPIIIISKAELAQMLADAVAAGVQVAEANPKLLHTVQDVAEMLSISERTAQALVYSGQLEAKRISGNPDSKNPALRVTRASIDAYLARI